MIISGEGLGGSVLFEKCKSDRSEFKQYFKQIITNTETINNFETQYKYYLIIFLIEKLDNITLDEFKYMLDFLSEEEKNIEYVYKILDIAFSKLSTEICTYLLDYYDINVQPSPDNKNLAEIFIHRINSALLKCMHLHIF